MPSVNIVVSSNCVKMSSIKFRTEDLFTILSERHTESDKAKYKMFCGMFLSPETKDSIILEWLSFIKNNIYLLDKNEDVVTVLLQMNWRKREELVIKLYSEVILNLVSAHTCYLSSVLQMIVAGFSSSSASSEQKPSLDANENEYAHELLKNIIRIVPMAPQMLMQVLVENFPYVRKSSNDCLNYVENLLSVIGYLPSHRQTILELIINRMLEIDVLCPKSEIEEMELEGEEDGAMFPVEMDCESSQCGMKDDVEMKHPLANSLDFLMEKIFCFIDDVCGSNDKTVKWEETKKLYKDFLTLFDRLILPTYACGHTQFILFYICRLKWSLCEGFIDYLWKKVQNPNLPPVMRQVASCYIGSLLARAKYIPISSVRDVFDVMTQWLHKYIDQQSGSKQAYVDRDIHGTFYTVCQTVFYIFAFRHKELVEVENGLKYLRGLNFERMVNCRLNPLKVCLPAVVTNFASVTRNYQLVYCYTVIERNNRSLIPVASQTSCGVTQPSNVTLLEVFFPFDPYLLKRSGKKIEPIYRVYEQLKEEKCISKDEDFLFEEPSPSMPSILAELEAFEVSPVFKKSVDIYR